MKVEIEFISVEERLPKLRITKALGGFAKEVTKQCLVTDGETFWEEYFDEDLGFHESITHWFAMEDLIPNM